MVIHQGDEVLVVELKGAGELLGELPDTVNELEKDRGLFCFRVRVGGVPVPVPELVPKAEPFLEGIKKNSHAHEKKGK